MRRVPFHFLCGLPGLSLTLNPRLMPGGLRGEWVLTVPVRRFCLYGARSESSCASATCFTALAAAVLLAASAGTASAQSPRIGFTPRSGSVNEGATAAPTPSTRS